MRVKKVLSVLVVFCLVMLPCAISAADTAQQSYMDAQLQMETAAGGGYTPMQIPPDLWQCIDLADFNSSTYGSWAIAQNSGKCTVAWPEINGRIGKSFAISVNAGVTSAAPYIVTTTPLRNKMGTGDMAVELELMLTGSATINMFQIRSQSGQFSTQATLSAQTISYGGSTSEQLELNRWYKICFAYNLQMQTCALYVDDTQLYSGAIVGANDGSFDNLRCTFMNYSDSQGANIYIDNIKVRSANEEALDVADTYYNSAGGDAVTNGRVNYGAKKIELKFNKPMNEATMTADNIALYRGTEKVSGTELSYSAAEQSAQITLGELLLPSTEYSVVISGDVCDGYGNTFGGEKKITFTTGNVKGSVWEVSHEVFTEGAAIYYNKTMTETITVTGDVDDIASAELYISGNKYSPVSGSNPYIFEFAGLSSGAHTAYVKITASDGGTFSSPTVNFVVDKTGLHITTDLFVAGAQVEYSEVITETVTISGDVDSITGVYLYVDGKKHLTNTTESPYVFRLSNLGTGLHTAYVRVVVSDGSATATQEVSFKIVSVLPPQSYMTDFNNSAYGNMAFANTASISREFADVDAEHGKSLAITPIGGSPSAYMETSAGVFQNIINTGDISIELELMLTTGASFSMFQIRSASGQFTTGAALSGRVLSFGGGSATLELGQWNNICFKYNLQEQTCSLYANGETVYSGAIVGSNDGSFYSVRITFSTTAGATFYIDNYNVKKSTTVPYASGLSYFMEDGSDALLNGAVSCSAKTIAVNFSGAMNAETVTDQSIRLYRGAEQISVQSVAYDLAKKSAIITLSAPLRSMSEYSVTVAQSLRDASGLKPAADTTLFFSTAPADYDVAEWRITRDGQRVFAEQLRPGDKITLEADIVNNTAQVRTGVIILVCFDEEKMIGYTAKPYSVNNGQTLKITTDEITLSFSGVLLAEGYAWEGLDRRTPVAARFSFK